MNDFEEIIERYLDDQQAVSDLELARLVVHLREHPELAVRMKEQLLVDELLDQKLAVDRQDFPAQVRQRVRDHTLGSDALQESANMLSENIRLRALGHSQTNAGPATALGQRGRRPRRRRSVRILLAAAALVVAALTVGLTYYVVIGARNVARFEPLKGTVTLIRDGKQQVVTDASQARSGDRFVTSKDGAMALHYQDGTTVHVKADAMLRVHGGWGKHLSIDKGNISATVQPQRLLPGMIFQTPAAVARVLGTELHLAVRREATRLDVAHGSVSLVRSGDDRSVVVRTDQFGMATADSLYSRTVSWPSRRDGAVFYTSGLPDRSILASTCGKKFFYQIEPHGDAYYGENGEVVLEGGSLQAVGADEVLLDACLATSELTIECLLAATDLNQYGPARIVTFSTDSSQYNFSLCQEGDRLVLRLMTTDQLGKARRSEVTLCQLPDTGRHHVVVTYRDGETACYLDVEKVLTTDAIRGSLDGWEDQHFLLGDEWQGGRSWKGVVYAVAIFNRALNHDEVRLNDQRLH